MAAPEPTTYDPDSDPRAPEHALRSQVPRELSAYIRVGPANIRIPAVEPSIIPTPAYPETRCIIIR